MYTRELESSRTEAERVVDVDYQVEGSRVISRDVYPSGTIGTIKSTCMECQSKAHALVAREILEDPYYFTLLSLGLITQSTIDKAAAAVAEKGIDNGG